MNIDLTLTQHLHAILPLEIQSVFQAYMVAAKNIRNKTVFVITNLQSAYSFDKNTQSFKLKEKLHQNQIDIIKIANKIINQLNQQNLIKHNKNNLTLAVDEHKEFKPMKLFDSVINKDTYYQAINKTLVEYIIKHQENNSPFKDYTIVNSILAQNTVHKVCDDFNYYYKSLITYYKNPSEFTGKPKKPSYKNQPCSFEISALRFNQNGSILGINKNHKLYLNFQKSTLVTDKYTELYNHFDLKSLLLKDLAKKPIFKQYSDISINSVRIIPCQARTANFKVEYTIGFTHSLNHHYLNIFDKVPDTNKLKEKDKYKLAKNYFNNTNNQSLPHVAGIDLGHVNVCSIYYFTGIENIDKNQADVISSKNFVSRINKIDLKLDKLKASYYHKFNKINNNNVNQKLGLDKIDINKVLEKLEKNKEIKEFNSQLEDKCVNNPLRKAKLEISLQEHQLLKEISKSIYKDKNYIRLNNAKNNITNDYIHKLSKAIVDNLLEKDISLLIVGKNTGWKTGSNLGSKNNRRGLNIPHSKLIELLKYKCLLHNIVLVEQEESYTSKRSFADNEDLPIYNKTSKSKKLEGNNKTINLNINNEEKFQEKGELNTAENKVEVKTKVLPQGKNSQVIRVGQKLYKKVIINNKDIKNKCMKRILICHADVNGAMNIIRKFINNFNIMNIKEALKNNPIVKRLQKIYDYRIVKLLNYKINSQALV